MLQEESINLASNVANFAGEMAPDELASSAAKLLSASGKFTAGVQGEQVSILYYNHNHYYEGNSKKMAFFKRQKILLYTKIQNYKGCSNKKQHIYEVM